MANRDQQVMLQDFRQRLQALSPEARDRALEAMAEVLILSELPADPNETWEIVVSLRRASQITYRSG